MHRFKLSKGIFAGLILYLVVFPFHQAWAEDQDVLEVEAIKLKLADIRKALEHPTHPLDEADRQLLETRLSGAEKAIERYSALARQGKTREQVTKSLTVAGTAIVVDDISGIGVADDELLALVALGLAITRATTVAPAAKDELTEAWRVVVATFASVAESARALAERRPRAVAKAVPVAASRKGCGCLCYRKGFGPDFKGQVPGPEACLALCVADQEIAYGGYRCGVDVKWFR